MSAHATNVGLTIAPRETVRATAPEHRSRLPRRVP